MTLVPPVMSSMMSASPAMRVKIENLMGQAACARQVTMMCSLAPTPALSAAVILTIAISVRTVLFVLNVNLITIL